MNIIPSFDASTANVVCAFFVAFAGFAIYVLRANDATSSSHSLRQMSMALMLSACAMFFYTHFSGDEQHALSILFWPLISAGLLLATNALRLGYEEADRTGSLMVAFGGSTLCLLMTSGWAREIILYIGIAVCLGRWIIVNLQYDAQSQELLRIRQAAFVVAGALALYCFTNILKLLSQFEAQMVAQSVAPFIGSDSVTSRVDIAVGLCAVALFALWMNQTLLRSDIRRRIQLDPLTGLASRDYLLQSTERWVKDHPIGVALMVVDIDSFRTINEKYGHSTGDSVLKHVGRTLKQALRKDSLVARYGGEEFGLVVPVADQSEADKVAERLRFEVEQQPFFIGTEAIQLTVSIGVTLYNEHRSLTQALVAADTCLHEAKAAGRNRVVAAI